MASDGLSNSCKDNLDRGSCLLISLLVISEQVPSTILTLSATREPVLHWYSHDSRSVIGTT